MSYDGTIKISAELDTEALEQGIASLGANIITALGTTGQVAGLALASAMSAAADQQLAPRLGASFTAAAPAAAEAGAAMASAMTGGFTAGAPLLGAATLTAAMSAASAAAGTAPQLAASGTALAQSLVTAFTAGAAPMTASCGLITAAAEAALLAASPTLEAAGTALSTSMLLGFMDGGEDIPPAAGSIAASAASAANAQQGAMSSAGANLIRGLWTGMNGMKPWLLSQVTALCQAMIATVMSSFGIASPSKVFEEQIGRNLMLGWASGIDAGVGDVARSLQNASGAALQSARMAVPVTLAGMGQGSAAPGGVPAQSAPSVNVTLEATGTLRSVAEVLGVEIRRVEYLSGVTS